MDHRLTVITATITALAGILGAAVGGVASGFFSYKTAHSQATAQADAALINRRQTSYSDYITAHLDRHNTEYTLADELRLSPADLGTLKATTDRWNELVEKAGHADYTVQLNDSDSVDTIRATIADKEKDIHGVISKLLAQANSHTAIDQSALHNAYTKLDAVADLYPKFLDAARADVQSPFS